METSFLTNVQPSYKVAGYIHIPKAFWDLFPDIETTLILEIVKEKPIQTGCYIGPNIRGFRSNNIKQWYETHSELAKGDKLRVTMIKKDVKYRLEILKE
jgi:hypothetical protein